MVSTECMRSSLPSSRLHFAVLPGKGRRALAFAQCAADAGNPALGLRCGYRLREAAMADTNVHTRKPGRAFPGHWVCFGCRKMFRKSAQACVCPQCAVPMIEMGPYFEPPKRSNRQMWDVLNALARD